MENFNIGQNVFFISRSMDWIKQFPNEVYVLSGTVDAIDYVGDKLQSYQIVKQKTNFIIPHTFVFATRKEAEEKLDEVLKALNLDHEIEQGLAALRFFGDNAKADRIEKRLKKLHEKSELFLKEVYKLAESL